MQSYAASQGVEPLRRSRRTLLVLALGLAVSSMTAAAGSLALFTDSEQVLGNQFTTSAVDIQVSPASAVVTYVGMMPGNSVTGSLTVTNGASAQLRYAMTSSSTNADSKNLRDQVTLEVRTQGTSCVAFDGTVLYTGTLASAAFGNAAAGSQVGDRVLNGSTSEVLCFKADLPLATGDAYQNADTTTTFTFAAEQTANNP